MTNKAFFTLQVAAVAAILVTAITGCTRSPDHTYLDVEKVTLSQEKLTLLVGESATLTATVIPKEVESTDVVWSSDTPSVATVDAATGEVTAMAVGRAVITATSRIGGKNGQCAVTVAPENILDAIPDPVFKAYAQFCMDNEHQGLDKTGNWNHFPPWDTDSDGNLSWKEAAPVENIALFLKNGEKVRTLEGLSYFTGLKVLTCMNHELAELDITQNTELTILNCEDNQLTELDATKNTELKVITCEGNQLAKLDVTQSDALIELYCADNQLTELDLTNNSALKVLYCYDNQLTELDVSKNTELIYFNCLVNQLAELDVTKNTELIMLDCAKNELTELDVSKNTALTSLECGGNQLTELDVKQNTALTYLDCVGNQLVEFDVSKNTALTELYCYKNQLKELDASKMAKPRKYRLFCGQQQNSKGGEQQLTLTLREEQKEIWDIMYANDAINYGVVLAQ